MVPSGDHAGSVSRKRSLVRFSGGAADRHHVDVADGGKRHLRAVGRDHGPHEPERLARRARIEVALDARVARRRGLQRRRERHVGGGAAARRCASGSCRRRCRRTRSALSPARTEREHVLGAGDRSCRRARAGSTRPRARGRRPGRRGPTTPRRRGRSTWRPGARRRRRAGTAHTCVLAVARRDEARCRRRWPTSSASSPRRRAWSAAERAAGQRRAPRCCSCCPADRRGRTRTRSACRRATTPARDRRRRPKVSLRWLVPSGAMAHRS